MYSYLTFKATRTPRLVKAGLGLKDAIEQATMFYDHSKILNDHELLVNGVSILVMEDAVPEDAQPNPSGVESGVGCKLKESL